MHLRQCLPWALLLALLPAASTAAQIPFSQPSPSRMTRTLVDALNEDPDYTSLLRLLQRTRLIPTLNRLNESTFFAPTNNAIKKHSSQPGSLWRFGLEEEADLVPDNIQEQLRQQLFYHLLNETMPALPKESSVPFYKTLLYPRKPLEPPTHEPPPYPPWMPIPGGTLGGEQQRLRLASLENKFYVGVDAFGQGGAKIVKGVQDVGNSTDNFVLLGVDDVLEPPPDLASIVQQYSTISYFQKIMTPEIMARLNSTPELTLFLPVDEAWEAFHPIERLYLESEFATDDLHRILDMHAVIEEHVAWSDSFESGLKLTTVKGTKLEFEVTPEGTKIRDAKLTQPDIYASNGVLHLVSSLLLPPDSLKLTPEKYLLALNCTKFVSLLHSAELEHLINDTHSRYTILAPSDDVLSIFEDPEFPEPGSEELKKLLQYHFIPGHWTPNKLKTGSLLETALKEPGLNDDSQVLSVEVQSEDKKKSASKTISFGGAGVIGDPVEVNNTLIYFVSRPLTPPPDVFQAALPFLDLSSFLAAVFSTAKAEALRVQPSTTFLIPHNDAFKRLGLLVSAHLLSASSKDDLENVIMHHVLDTVQYAAPFQNGSQHSFSTLEGSDVKVDRFVNGTALVSSSGGWADLRAGLQTRDLLTKTGVIHELSDIMIPRSVSISIGKLVKAAKGSTMSTLVNKAGFEWILNGTAPPEGSPWSDANVGWTLLCPPDDAFKTYNLTQLYSDLEGLRSLVAQHLIPTPVQAIFGESDDPVSHNRPLVLEDATYSTLQSEQSAYGDIVFQRKTGSADFIVGIKGARGTDGKDDTSTLGKVFRLLYWV
ncbi:hypothetical protein NLJ89_g1099 [Agrocybe chaxingu]|uniref:FAS1 domain-containing protein n=1 Tax=Agrocybe chaxingu TaxID=84603 RepID=A0A9W8TDV4_9AGAR|nr:hypothetical protein NLJ89_g1099 [Agrocybe chaxingu]